MVFNKCFSVNVCIKIYFPFNRPDTRLASEYLSCVCTNKCSRETISSFGTSSEPPRDDATITLSPTTAQRNKKK